MFLSSVGNGAMNLVVIDDIPNLHTQIAFINIFNNSFHVWHLGVG